MRTEDKIEEINREIRYEFFKRGIDPTTSFRIVEIDYCQSEPKFSRWLEEVSGRRKALERLMASRLDGTVKLYCV